MAGVSYCDGSYRIVRPASHITVMEYVLAGEGTVLRSGRAVPVGEDQIYILKRGEDHDYRSGAENPWKKIFLNIEGDLPVTLMQEYHIEDEWLFEDRELRPVFEAAAKALESGSESLQQQLCALVFYVISRLGTNGNRLEHTSEAIRLKNYLDNLTFRIVSNQELSAHIFRSPDYCVKLFRREYGLSPYDYQIRTKMRIARRLLRDTALTVSEIAQAVGYHDAKYFSGLFKQKCGVCPREYRKSEQHNG